MIVAIPIMGMTATLTGYTGNSAWLIWLFAFALMAAPWNQQWLMQGLEMMGFAAGGQFLRTLVFALGILFFVRKSQDFWVVGIVVIIAVFTSFSALPEFNFR